MSSKKKKTSQNVPLLGGLNDPIYVVNPRNRTGIDDITDIIQKSGDKKQEEVFKKLKEGVGHDMSVENILKDKREKM